MKLLTKMALVIGTSAVVITGVVVEYYFLSVVDGSTPSPATMLFSVCAVVVIISMFWSTPPEAWGGLVIWLAFILLGVFYVFPAIFHHFSSP